MNHTIETLSAGYPADAVRSALAALTLQPAPIVRVGMDWARDVPPMDETPPRAPYRRPAKRAPRSKTRQFAYRVGTPFRGRGGTWTSHMVLTMQRHATTRDAETHHAASGLYSDKKLHWSWAVEKGYIVEVAP